MIRYQDVSVECIHDVPLARLYNVPCKSKIKHPKTLLWYVSSTSRSYFFCDVLLIGLYYTFKLLCCYLHQNGEIPIHLDGKLQNLISRKSMPPFQNQPFADVLQSRCSQYLQENTCVGVSFLKSSSPSGPQL